MFHKLPIELIGVIIEHVKSQYVVCEKCGYELFSKGMTYKSLPAFHAFFCDEPNNSKHIDTFKALSLVDKRTFRKFQREAYRIKFRVGRRVDFTDNSLDRKVPKDIFNLIVGLISEKVDRLNLSITNKAFYEFINRKKFVSEPTNACRQMILYNTPSTREMFNNSIVKMPCNRDDITWTNSIGHSLIESVSFSIGGQVVDDYSGEWLNIRNQFTNTKALSTMKGQQKYVYNKEKRAYVENPLLTPLKFWFSEDPGFAVPMIVIAQSYNISRISNGMGGLMYAS